MKGLVMTARERAEAAVVLRWRRAGWLGPREAPPTGEPLFRREVAEAVRVLTFRGSPPPR